MNLIKKNSHVNEWKYEKMSNHAENIYRLSRIFLYFSKKIRKCT